MFRIQNKFVRFVVVVFCIVTVLFIIFYILPPMP
jgi:hypothetical protein